MSSLDNTTSIYLLCSMLQFVLICTTILCASTIRAKNIIQFSNESDSQALMAIKGLIKDDPFNILSSWNHSTNLCKWEGITCSRQKQYHRRVVALDLPSFKLSGSLSPAIGNLTFLMKIDLGNNTLYGSIPQEIGRLSHLQFLYLPYNNFSGEFPVNLTNCLDIKTIYLLNNNLHGKIPYQLGRLSSLENLVLGNNGFIEAIPSSFGNLSSLTQLSLMNNKLDGNIPPEMEQLSKLKFLQLSGNNFSGMVPYGLYNITSIYHFDIAMNSLGGTLPLDLGSTFPKLESLLVGRNQFYGSIPSSIGNASKLVELGFSYNAFTGPLPQNFGYLRDLQILYASGNNLGNSSTHEYDELGVFLTSLSNCTSIQRLALKDNNLRGSLHPKTIGNLSTTFTYLILAQNYIYGNIPTTIGELVNLQYLALDENMFHGTLPNSLGKLSQLDQLYISLNNISGEIPSSFGNFSKLSILSLYDNMLEGTIPVSLSSCLNLRGMDLSYNRLTGTLPAQVAGISSLTGILLQHNLLVGSLPQEVSRLMNMGILDISENQFSGEIPPSLGSCPVLEILLMQGNLLEGGIPASFEKLRGLQILDVSRNNLSGPVPSFLGEFEFLNSLNLSNNKFEGEVPTEGVFKNITAFSVAGDNKLCGGIKALQLPPCPSSKAPHKWKNSAKNKKLVISVVVPIVVLLLICLSALVFFSRRRKRKQNSPSPPSKDAYPRVTYAELHQATNGFSSENLIGQGQYGTVYKGILSDQIVAIKVLNLQKHGSDKSFFVECEALRVLRHRNLVRIITTCSSIDLKGEDFKALVFQFMENGSLEGWLHQNPAEAVVEKKLNLLQRLNIAIDVASALDYLHHQCESVVTHCDLKPGNVLLDNDFCAHVSDFGIAKILGGSYSNQQSSSIAVRGTVGYVAPEYGMGMKVSTQGDMYSYGILLLELLTGKRPTSEEMNDRFSLHSYVKHFLPDRVIEIADPNMIIWDENEKIQWNDENRKSYMIKFEANLASILQIGVCCSANSPSERINAGDALEKLHKVKTMYSLPLLGQP